MNLWPFICSYSRSFADNSLLRPSRSSSKAFLSLMTTSFFLATRFACCLYTESRESWLCSSILRSRASLSSRMDWMSCSIPSMSAFDTGGSLRAASILPSCSCFSSISLRTRPSWSRPFFTSLRSIFSIASALPSPSCCCASRISRSRADRSTNICSVDSRAKRCSCSFSDRRASSSCSFRSMDVTCSSCLKPSSLSVFWRRSWIFCCSCSRSESSCWTSAWRSCGFRRPWRSCSTCECMALNCDCSSL
mmetsp:Transcript_110542/g.291870  ORF Transcript_110542/g.291870 Transcript_110542/m.291870 type:complete len:249 (-) Transcript_110542:460-1206(-)